MPDLIVPSWSELHISRTVILPELSEVLLPAISCLPLKSLELVNTGLQRQSFPHLAKALQRPTSISIGSGPSPLHSIPSARPSSATQGAGTVPLDRRRSVKVSEQSVFHSRIATGAAAAAAEARAAEEAAALAASVPPRPLGPNWWLTLQDLDLSGNNLGDDGLQVIMPQVMELRDLRKLTLRQAGLSDWSAPQVNPLLGDERRLMREDLSVGAMASFDRVHSSLFISCHKIHPYRSVT